MEKSRARVSLLMTTYNCREHFRESIQDALGQDYPDLEIVIKDGGSTDGTVDLIGQYADAVNQHPEEYPGKRILWSSAEDLGIYDGMNQAYQMSTGDIIAVFNDRFTCRDAVSQMVRAINSEHSDGVHSDLIYEENGRCKRYWRMGQGKLQFGWMPAHPTLYLRREIYERYGLYDLSYVSSADYDFVLRILRDRSVKLAYIPRVLISMYYGGTSNGGAKGYLRNMKEAYRALQHNRIPFPVLAIVSRILITAWQYIAAGRYEGNIL